MNWALAEDECRHERGARGGGSETMGEGHFLRRGIRYDESDSFIRTYLWRSQQNS